MFSDKNGTEGGVNYNSKTQAIDIGMGETSNALVSHEINHAYQYENQKTSFVIDNSRFGALYDVSDETESYNIQRVMEAGKRYYEQNLQWTNSDVVTHGKSMIPPAYQNLPSGPIDINSKEGKALRNRTIEAGKTGQPVQEVYRGWQKDYEKGAKR